MRAYLKELRINKAATQEETAAALNISQNYYSQIENGIKQKNIDLRLLIKLSDFFEVDLQSLVNDEVRYINTIQRKGA